MNQWVSTECGTVLLPYYGLPDLDFFGWELGPRTTKVRRREQSRRLFVKWLQDYKKIRRSESAAECIRSEPEIDWGRCLDYKRRREATMLFEGWGRGRAAAGMIWISCSHRSTSVITRVIVKDMETTPSQPPPLIVERIQYCESTLHAGSQNVGPSDMGSINL